MRIILRFDEDVMREYVARGAQPLFEIAWVHEDVFYPERSWMDFGGVLLGWWLNSLNQLLSGADEVGFYFMEGPYSLIARHRARDGTVHLVPEGCNVTWLVKTEDLAEAILQAAHEVSNKFDQMQIDKIATSSLRRSIPVLKQAWDLYNK
jgi:hypothetical protein